MLSFPTACCPWPSCVLCTSLAGGQAPLPVPLSSPSICPSGRSASSVASDRRSLPPPHHLPAGRAAGRRVSCGQILGGARAAAPLVHPHAAAADAAGGQRPGADGSHQLRPLLCAQRQALVITHSCIITCQCNVLLLTGQRMCIQHNRRCAEAWQCPAKLLLPAVLHPPRSSRHGTCSTVPSITARLLLQPSGDALLMHGCWRCFSRRLQGNTHAGGLKNGRQGVYGSTARHRKPGGVQCLQCMAGVQG